VDLASATYALRFDPAVVASGRRLPVLAAEEVHATLRALAGDEVDEVLAVETVRGGDVREVGPLTLAFADVVHPVPTVAVAIDDGRHRIVVSGDTAASEGLVELARGADLLVCEATWTGRADEHPPGIHLTAEGAGAIAHEAGVARLVLTHLAGATDRARALAEARAAFAGPVTLAEDLATYAVAASD
jgi:ribonuclease BN (tRNA processing enzyme)